MQTVVSSVQPTGGNVSSRVDQEIAPAGHYAFNGVLYVCPAGYYGAVPGLTSPSCSGACNVPGYFCPGERHKYQHSSIAVF
jgi:hypothetical protein